MVLEHKTIFINKTAKSKYLSHSEGLERSRIYSHAQRAPTIPSRLPYESYYDPLEPTASKDCNRSNTVSVSKKQDTGTLNRPTRPRKSMSKTNTSRTSLNTSSSYMPSPLVALNITGIDPFQSTALPINPYMDFLLKFYSSSIMPQIYPIKALAEVSRRSTFSLASQDPILMNALLCTTSGSLYAYDGDSKHAFSFIYFKGQTIHYLQQKLSNLDNEIIGISSVFAVSLLLWIECVQGNVDDLQAHVKGLEHLVARSDDMNRSPLPIMTTVLACSYLCSAMTGARPGLTPILLCQDQISQPTLDALDNCPIPGLNSMASRFFDLTNATLLGPKILHLISQQRKYVLFKELCAHNHLSPTYEDVQFIYTTQMSVEHQLLLISFDTVHPPLTPFQDAVRIALFVFAQPIITVTNSSSAFTRSMARQLVQSVELTEPSSLWSPSFDLLLWVLFIVAHIFHGQAEWAWAIAYIRKLTRGLSIGSLEEMEEMLLGFYYFEKYFDGTLHDVWRDVQQMLRVSERSLG